MEKNKFLGKIKLLFKKIEENINTLFFGILSGTGLFSVLMIIEEFQILISEPYLSIIFVVIYLGIISVTSMWIRNWFRWTYIISSLVWLLIYLYVKIFGQIL